ncbi:O-antigen ligase domain-containing protein [Micromonospora sp. DSM 115977]|uniref:O-antigen ligase domain-containing protein n=2 Tax=Micromonospora reichwaldensis TaxID=3075516 RepID=A0ABU2X3E8_9ACTN|nr:O-antigen ligase family protein [Micromonospora sp. DSM 115977]MDT0532728.1 O-antigen ligase domain-containing protein [Micromonospora sp. DSM 115977]
MPQPPPPPRLPLWPLALMFGLVPVWWLAGAFYLGWPLLGALLFALLFIRGRVPLPPAAGIWLLFLAIVVVSATQLQTPASVLTFALRLAFYLTALVVGVYVYAVARERPDQVTVLLPLCAFWFGLVALGWLGVLAPRFALTTPVEVLLPGGVANTPFIQDMVHLTTAEYSARSLNPIYRPAAPFAYTNNYGSAYAMTLPCVVAFTMLRRRGALRWALLASLPLSLAPAFLTLNRAMFLSLGAGLAVLGVRAALRGNVRVAASIVGVVVTGGLVTLFIPVTQLIGNRVESSDTNTDRLSLYVEVIRRVRESPWLGYGAPVNVDTVSAEAPIGTQGQLWMVLFSHGVPALLCFLAWFVVAALICARATSAAGQWLAVVPVVCLVQIPFYGMANQNLAVAFFAVAFAMALTERETAARLHRPRIPRPKAVPA